MNNYVMINGKAINENASLSDVRALIKRYNLKLVQTYTFKMRTHMRRVLKFEAQGTIYSVRGPKHYIDWNAYSQDCIYFGFDKDKAYSLGGEVNTYEAKNIDFTSIGIKRFFTQS